MKEDSSTINYSYLCFLCVRFITIVFYLRLGGPNKWGMFRHRVGYGFLSCGELSRLKISPNLSNYMPYEGMAPISHLIQKNLYYRWITNFLAVVHIIYLCIKEHLSKIGNNHTKKLRLLFRQYTEFSHHLCISLRDFLEK